MALARIYLWIGVVASLVFGGIYLVSPELMTEPMGIRAVEPAGFTDIRATYGGIQLGMGAFLAWCLRDARRYPAGLMCFGLVVGGLGICRAIGLAVDGPSAQMAAATVLEWGMSGVAFFALSRLGQVDRESAA